MPNLADRTLQAVEKDLGGETYKFLLTTSAVQKARRKGWVNEDTEVSGDSAEELTEAAEEGDDESLQQVLALVAAARLPYEEDITPEMVDQSMSFFEVVSVFEKISDAHIDEDLAEELGEGKGKKA
jgi:hypothetical protein